MPGQSVLNKPDRGLWDQDVWPLLSGQNKTSPRVEVPLSALPGAAMVAAPENGFRDPM